MHRLAGPLFEDFRECEAFFADASDPFEGDPEAGQAWLTDCLAIETRLRRLLSSSSCPRETTAG